MPNRFTKSSLSQQLALVAAGLCLLVSLALIALGTISNRHMQVQLQDDYGNALAQLVARRISTAMENGDLLSASANLRRFVAISGAEKAVLTDVEGKRLGQAGSATGTYLFDYSAPVYIESDVAGEVTITINTDTARGAQRQLILSLLGLALLLALAVYGGTRHVAQKLGDRLSRMARVITLEDDSTPVTILNEIQHLQNQIEGLPMDLLRTRSEPVPQEENYQTTAVLYLHLNRLASYIDTLDELALQRYILRLHQVVYAAAGFYAGEIQVARQFGLAVYFTGENKAGSASFRAASCAWLISSVCKEMAEQMTLPLSVCMAISQSELGVGNGDDIYPGLYMQHTLDELQGVCQQVPQGILLAPALSEDVDIASRLKARPVPNSSYGYIEEFASTYRDLLDRQLQLILRKLNDPVNSL